MKATDCLGKMNQFAELAVEVIGRPWYDSKGNKIQSFKVKCMATGKLTTMGYHVRELGSFRIVPGTAEAKTLIKSERAHWRKCLAYEKAADAWSARVLRLLARGGIIASDSGSRGIVNVSNAGARRVKKYLKECGIDAMVTTKMMSWDKKTVVSPVRVWIK